MIFLALFNKTKQKEQLSIRCNMMDHEDAPGRVIVTTTDDSLGPGEFWTTLEAQTHSIESEEGGSETPKLD